MFKKSVTFFLILSFIAPFFYLPQQAPKVQAGLPVVDIPARVERVIDAVAMSVAQQLIDRMVASTVKWAQSGFEGNPAYVTDPKQYFADIADGVAGEYLLGSDLGFLCSPFQANIRVSLTQQYYEPEPFQCTLTGAVANVENFLDDFSEGGWNGWFSMTQVATNNPYGAYLEAKVELDSRIAEKLGLEKEQLDRNQGFLNWSSCTKTNPEPWIDDPGQNGNLSSRKPNPAHVPSKAVGECIERGPVKTPGSIIKSQLDKALSSPLEKLVNAEHFDQLISAFATGLLTRYVFGPKGLFASNTQNTRASPGSDAVVDSRFSKIDLDGDKIPEGQDFDKDGLLDSAVDVCFHGGNPPECVRSVGLTQSPYLEPFCQAVERAVVTLTDYTTFLDANAKQVEGGASLAGQIIGQVMLGPVGVIFGRLFGGGSADNFKDKADSNIWYNRTAEVDAAVNGVVTSVQNYKIPYFDPVEIAANRFAFYTDKVIESLVKDQDLDLAGAFRSGGGGLANLMKHSAYNLRYFKEVKTKLGKCEIPNAAGVGNIPLPPSVEPGIEGPSCPGPALPLPPGEAPDMSSVVSDVNREFPGLIKTSAENFDFLDKVVERLHEADSNWGYNGKRGDPSNLSRDVVAYLAEGPDKPESVHIIDIIVAHDSPDAAPDWNDVTEETYSCGAIGIYVYPR